MLNSWRQEVSESVDMIVTAFKLLAFVGVVCGVQYDPYGGVVSNQVPDNFDLRRLEQLYADWKSIQLNPDVTYFPSTPQFIFGERPSLKNMIEKSTGNVTFSNFTVSGFEDQRWQYWTAPSGTPPCDSCSFSNKVTAERYYGGFSARLRSYLAKVHLTLDGKDYACDVLGLATNKNSLAHHTVANKQGVQDDLNYLRVFFDFAFVSSPPIGVEIKNWTFVDDWPFDTAETRHFLEKMQDNSTWPQVNTSYHAPMFRAYVDPKCIGLSYSKTVDFNNALSEYLDLQVPSLVSDAMQSHFLANLGEPYALKKIGGKSKGQPAKKFGLANVAPQRMRNCYGCTKDYQKMTCKCQRKSGTIYMKNGDAFCKFSAYDMCNMLNGSG